jgi:hypothetical protein
LRRPLPPGRSTGRGRLVRARDVPTCAWFFPSTTLSAAIARRAARSRPPAMGRATAGSQPSTLLVLHAARKCRKDGSGRLTERRHS